MGPNLINSRQGPTFHRASSSAQRQRLDESQRAGGHFTCLFRVSESPCSHVTGSASIGDFDWKYQYFNSGAL